MSGREFVVLGTSSTAPTRSRNQNGYALRWDDLLVLFDPGEGYQRQALLGGVKIARADAVLITHFHGDHCLGLPGLVYRRMLDNPDHALPIYYPGLNDARLGHLLSGALPEEDMPIVRHPVVEPGTVGQLGGPERIGNVRLSAAQLAHPVPTFGYRLDEPDSTRLDDAGLRRCGITGQRVGELLDTGRCVADDGRTFHLESFQLPRAGQSMAFVLDSEPCDGALELAEGVDLLVCEATYLDTERDVARNGGHMTAREAGRLAAEAGARRLVLTHFSARYRQIEPFGEEAAAFHADVVVATDLATIPIPTRPHRQRTSVSDQAAPERAG